MSGLVGTSLRDAFPFRLFIGSEDVTQLLDSSFTFSNIDPGGFEAASFSVPRDMPQTIRGLPVVLTSGLRVAWEGRVGQIQRSLGQRTTINCMGYGDVFKEQQRSMVFVDRDLTRWREPELPRQIALNEAHEQAGSSSIAADPTGSPALVQTISGNWVEPWRPLAESWYDSGQGNLIGYIWLALTLKNASGGSFGEKMYVSIDNFTTGVEGTGNLNNSGAGKTEYWIPSTQKRYALAQHQYEATPAGAAGAENLAFWKLAVYGNHGLPGRGSDPVGFYPWDIAGWVVAQVPQLQRGIFTEATSYIIPHYVQYVPVTLDQILDDMAVQGGMHWGVWEPSGGLTGSNKPRLDFRQRPELGQWTAYCKRQDCDTLDMREDLANMYNKAAIEYTNIDGTQGTAEASFANPVLEAVGLNRAVNLNIGTSTPAAAEVFAKQALELLYSQARVAGTATISSSIDGPAGPMPAWLLKAGIDRLRVGDLPSTDAFGKYNDMPITRVECSGSESGFTTTIEFGVGGSFIDSLQSRLGAAATLAAQGGD